MDKEFSLLASAANFIKPELLVEREEWNGSPFEWILNLPAGTKGKLGKKLILQWCALKGLSTNKSPDSEADGLINNHRVEFKFSTLWKQGIYKFQQLRNQNYEYAVCLGISPFTAHCWVVNKKTLLKHVIGHQGQHTGAGGIETAWFSVDPNNPPEWIAGLGGSLDKAYEILKMLSR